VSERSIPQRRRTGDISLRRRVTKEPYESYTLPKSSELGVAFVDFNEVLKGILPRKVKIIKKKRIKNE